MPKITLTDLSTTATVGSQTTAINNNNQILENAIDNTLSRDGTSPNAMEADLDMNSNHILNLPEAVDNTSPVRKGDMPDYIPNFFIQSNQPSTTVEGSLWVDSDSADKDLYQLRNGIWTDTNVDFEAGYTTLNPPAIDVSFTPAGPVTSTNVQAAIEEVAAFIPPPPAATDVSFTPAGSISSNNVQAALQELDTEKQPVDATLTALAGYNTNGILTQTAADTFVGRSVAGTTGQITVTNGDGVAGDPTVSLPADVVIPTILTTPNTGLHVLDTNASHDLIIKPGSDLTADRTFTLTTGNADRTLDISAANVTISSLIAPYLNSTTNSQFQISIGVREVLTANRDYYVRTDGSDSNDGLTNSPSGAFLTIQKALDVAGSLDFSIYNVTINVGAGTFSGTGSSILKAFAGSGTLNIIGAGAGSTTISRTSGTCFYGDHTFCKYRISDMKLQTTTSGDCIFLFGPGLLNHSGIEFGTSAGTHLRAEQGASLVAIGNYSISGGATYHMTAGLHSRINSSGRTVTTSSTPAFSIAYAGSNRLSYVLANGMTFTGTGATGSRYVAISGGFIDTNGGGASYFPGSTAGSTSTGGTYL